MASGTPAQTESATARKPPDAIQGISQFLAKVLDQLSLTSWLPAVVLVSGFTLMIKFHQQKNLSITEALQDVSSGKPVGLLVVLLFAVIVAATLTQAFAFELIRFLEGYWGATRVAMAFTALGVAWHRRGWGKARQKLEERRGKAFDSACKALESAPGYGPAFVDLLRWRVAGAPRDTRPKAARTLRQQAARVDWRDHAPAALLDSEDRWRARLDDYPAPSRLLPTRLGNVLRAREDKLRKQGYDLEHLVMQRYRNIPARLLLRHDEFRGRLEMYCVLAATVFVLAIGSVPLLSRSVPHGHWYTRWSASTTGCLLLLVLAWTCYQAAIASARGYGSVLIEIGRLPVDDQHSDVGRQEGVIVRLFAGVVRVFSPGP